MSIAMDFLTVFLQPQLLLLVGLGTFSGVYVGAIPGLSVTMAVSILISFTFSWEVQPAIALMIGIYMGGVYGGSRTAILLNIPGAPSAIATALDGYPLAKRGEAGTAIGVTTVMSFIGGFIGIGVLALAAPLVSEFALRFQPRDYMLLAILGILLVGSLSQGSLLKGIFTGALGLAIGAVGRDPLTFAERFTFDVQLLEGGISFIAVMIGMFGVSEALLQLHHVNKDAIRQKISRVVPSLATVRKHLPLSLQTSSIGVVIGALPGTGSDIAALMAYDHAKRVTKNPERPFGDGAIEGLVAPETANNAAVGGAFIPMMTLGIPGDAVTAIMIGALFIHGLNPGPMLMVDQPDMFWSRCRSRPGGQRHRAAVHTKQLRRQDTARTAVAIHDRIPRHQGRASGVQCRSEHDLSRRRYRSAGSPCATRAFVGTEDFQHSMGGLWFKRVCRGVRAAGNTRSAAITSFDQSSRETGCSSRLLGLVHARSGPDRPAL